MLGRVTMSVENNISSDILQKEERFLKCTSKKKSETCAVKPSENSRVFLSDGHDDDLMKSKSRESDDVVRQTLSKAVAFLSDSNANTANSSVTVSDSSSDKVNTFNKEMRARKLSTNNAQHAKPGKKRHQSVSQATHSNQKPMPFSKRRRKTIERNPTPQFLMGGNITDPLNLNSLADEEISKVVNQIATPLPSPASQQRLNKDPDPVIVPDDFTDPLKLNSEGGDDNALLTRTLISRTGSGKKKRKGGKSDRKDEDIDVTSPIAKQQEGILSQTPTSGIEPARLLSLQLSGNHSKVIDKIVSPVVPDSLSKFRKRKNFKQDPSCKISRALLIESDEDSAESNSVQKHSHRNASPEKRKYKRQHSNEAAGTKTVPKFQEQNKKFQYGNYNRYYGYRNPDKDDPRLSYFKREWFAGKTCLDIGCNTGHVTLYIAKNFLPEKMVGIDIDSNLIGIARKNIKHCLLDKAKKQSAKEMGDQKFPISMEKSFGLISKAATSDVKKTCFPANVLFRCANFVLTSDSLLQAQKPEYEVVLCLSVTKWIHLNWGDDGIKRFFRRIYLALKPGGYFILEPQAWPSYKKKKKLTETIFQNYQSIQFKPDQFKSYLLSSEVGFSSCETVGVPSNQSKGFRRPMLMFTKLTPEKTHRHHYRRHSSDHRLKESTEEEQPPSSSHHHLHHHQCPSSSSITTERPSEEHRQRHLSASSALSSSSTTETREQQSRPVHSTTHIDDPPSGNKELREKVTSTPVKNSDDLSCRSSNVDSESTGVEVECKDNAATLKDISSKDQEPVNPDLKSDCDQKNVKPDSLKDISCKDQIPNMKSDCTSDQKPAAHHLKSLASETSGGEPEAKKQKLSTGNDIKIESRECKKNNPDSLHDIDNSIKDQKPTNSEGLTSNRSSKSSRDQDSTTQHPKLSSSESSCQGEPAAKKQKLSPSDSSEKLAPDAQTADGTNLGTKTCSSKAETETTLPSSTPPKGLAAGSLSLAMCSELRAKWL